jgi:7-carboxy-7-deazaguanine synthase
MERDLVEIDALLRKLRGWSPEDVLLMPEGTTEQALAERSSWLSEACKRTGFRYCPRMHIELYGNTRGTLMERSPPFNSSGKLLIPGIDGR